jgi:phosphohistidine phosphatase
MKRTLYLVRHAKSSWLDPQLADFERPLNDRGLRNAPFMGEIMREHKLIPSVIVSSPAARARHTAELVKKGGNFDAEIIFEPKIYEASTNTLREVISNFADSYEKVMLVGHNPGMEGFVRFVSGSSETMPTASVAVVDLELNSWIDLEAECCTLRHIYRPKELTRV